MSIVLYTNPIVTCSSSIFYKNGRLDLPPSSSFWKDQYSFRERPVRLKLEAQAAPEGPERGQKHHATIFTAC